MKLLRYLLILCTISTVLSCKKEPKITYPENHAIQIQPSIQTKGYIASAQDVTFRGQGFSVFAKKTEKAAPFNSAEIMDNTRVYYDVTNFWHYDGNKVYWGLDCSHDFLAVYPRKDGMKIVDSENDSDTDKNEIEWGPINTIASGSTEGNNIGEDIMFGVVNNREYHLGQIPSPIKITFNHALSALSFNIWNASDDNITYIKNIKIAGLISNATELTIWRKENIDPKLTVGTNRVTYTFSQKDNFPKDANTTTGEKQYKAIVDPCIIIPQEFKGQTVTLSFDVKFENNENTVPYSIQINKIALDNETAALSYTYLYGKHYLYNLDITENYITCEVQVVPWIKDDMIELK